MTDTAVAECVVCGRDLDGAPAVSAKSQKCARCIRRTADLLLYGPWRTVSAIWRLSSQDELRAARSERQPAMLIDDDVRRWLGGAAQPPDTRTAAPELLGARAEVSSSYLSYEARLRYAALALEQGSLGAFGQQPMVAALGVVFDELDAKALALLRAAIGQD